MTSLGDDTPREAILEALRRLLGSGDFQASERNRRFLEHVVDETLAGRADRIKAYSIATAVFGRDDAFDAQADPIVRIEASRLRRAVERYYLTAGSEDPIRITIPKGSYVPCFERIVAAPETSDGVTGGDAADVDPTAPVPQQPEAAPHPAPRRARPALLAGMAAAMLMAGVLGGWLATWRTGAESQAETVAARHGPAIFVSTFASEGETDVFADFGKGFTRELIIGLTRFNDLFVFGPETTFRYGGPVDHRQVATDLEVDFVLTGGTVIDGERFKVETLLINARSGQYVWAERFDGTLGTDSILVARDRIAEHIARSLAQPYGVIFDNRARDTAGRPPDSLTSYECVTRFYLYWRIFRQTEFAGVRDCLERAIDQDPGYAEAFAALSLVHSDTYRFSFGSDQFEGDPRKRAQALARRAIELAPESARAHHALAVALWLANDVEGSLEAAATGLAFNPNDAELMAELGMRYVFRNAREKGSALVREAFARNPAQPSIYRLPLFLDHYVAGRHEAALAEARQISAQNIIYGHIALAMAAGQLGLQGEATASVDRILAIDPRYGPKVVADLEGRNIHSDLIPLIVEGLRKAGLPVNGPRAERS